MERNGPQELVARSSSVGQVWLHAFLATTMTLFMFSTVWSGPGAFAYPLDDTYIHMAIGQTLAHHGVWGAVPYAPASASSSPLWTLLLAAVYATPIGQFQDAKLYTPLVLNLMWQASLIWLFVRVLPPHLPAWLAALLAWVPTGVVGTSAIGMEHVAHTVLQLAFTWQAAHACAQRTPLLPRQLRLLCVLAALAALSRYEALFVVGPVVGWLLWQRKVKDAACVAAAAATPLVLLGLWWVHQGGWMLPNSLLLKGAGSAATSDLFGRALGIWQHVQNNLHTRAAWSTLALMALHAALCWLPVNTWVRTFSWLTLTSSLTHVALASFGWLYRYDTYLVAGNLMAVALLLSHARWQFGALTWSLLALAVAVLLPRTWNVWAKTPMAMDDRRWEHLMPAEFVKALPRGTVLMVNDLGIFAYDEHAQVIDMFGLGHNTPVRLRHQPGGYDREALTEFARDTNTSLAILLPCWPEIRQRIPDTWQLVGWWHGHRNVVANEKDVALFKTRRDSSLNVQQLIARMRQSSHGHNVSVREAHANDLNAICNSATEM